MEFLIDDLLLVIFDNLRFSELAKLREVNKNWQRLIDSNYRQINTNLIKDNNYYLIEINSKEINSILEILKSSKDNFIQTSGDIDQVIYNFDRRIEKCNHSYQCNNLCRSKKYTLQFDVFIIFRKKEYLMINQNQFIYAVYNSSYLRGGIQIPLKNNQIAILKFLKEFKKVINSKIDKIK